ncbi:MAG: T9SS type A sorting domain-containing protein [Bacteroidetes bacterium]|nr:T9SS type A sorting domain-containing protein [Bacteroidota bacterium]
MKLKTLLIALLALFVLQNRAQTVTDIDGNIYNTVTIGTQVWMKENLKTTHYQNGDSIGSTYPATKSVTSEFAPKYQWLYNGADSLKAYGRMYTWHAVSDSRNVCPTGWHAATEAEWRDLGIYLGGDSIAGAKLKETGTGHWTSPNNATNSTGFSARPGGIRFGYGTFTNINTYGTWWTSSEYSATYGLYRLMINTDKTLGRYSGLKNNAYSVRCVSNNPATGVNNYDRDEKISVFPNPASEMIYISGVENTVGTVTIYNLIGELVVQRELGRTSNGIDIAALNRGVYFIQLSTSDRVFKQKFIRQ